MSTVIARRWLVKAGLLKGSYKDETKWSKATDKYDGLTLDSSGYDTLSDLRNACEQSQWDLDPSILDFPLIPDIKGTSSGFRLWFRLGFGSDSGSGAVSSSRFWGLHVSIPKSGELR